MTSTRQVDFQKKEILFCLYDDHYYDALEKGKAPFIHTISIERRGLAGACYRSFVRKSMRASLFPCFDRTPEMMTRSGNRWIFLARHQEQQAAPMADRQKRGRI